MEPVTILCLEGVSFLYLLGAILVLKMLMRRIHLKGLFSRKTDFGQVSAERIQLLIATLMVSGKYLSDAIHSTNGAMPEVSPHLIYLFGGSSGIYASVKALTTWKAK
jgi:hypothetical protein